MAFWWPSDEFLMIFQWLSDAFLMTFWWFSQDFLGTFLGHSQDFLRFLLGLSQDSFKAFAALSWTFLGPSHYSLKSFSWFSQVFLRTFSGIFYDSQDFLRSFSILSFCDALGNQSFLRGTARREFWSPKRSFEGYFSENYEEFRLFFRLTRGNKWSLEVPRGEGH